MKYVVFVVVYFGVSMSMVYGGLYLLFDLQLEDVNPGVPSIFVVLCCVVSLFLTAFLLEKGGALLRRLR